MRKRGRILRDPAAGPGLLMVEGQQYQFLQDGVWKSEIPPTKGTIVEVEFDSGGSIKALRAAAESQRSQEQTEDVTKSAGQKSNAMSKLFRRAWGKKGR
jgi:hypothetical protein